MCDCMRSVWCVDSFCTSTLSGAVCDDNNAQVSSAEGSHVAGTELTVIAGQGVDRGTTTPATTATTAITATTADNAVGVDAAGSEHHDHHGDNDDDAVATAQRPFRLVETIQDMLIEEFHPPISSSTAPDNPGRVLIRL